MSRVLLDECMPHALRNYLPNHEVVTASYAGLAGYKNGALLRAAEDLGFDVLLTGDGTMQHEQNLKGRKLALVSLSVVSWRIVRNHLSGIAAAVDAATPGSFTRVECGRFVRSIRPAKGHSFG